MRRGLSGCRHTGHQRHHKCVMSILLSILIAPLVNCQNAPMRVLFVGNSFTFRNGGVDQVTAQILNSLNLPTIATRVTSQGEGWDGHLADALNPSSQLYSVLGNGGTEQYTYVVFQEKSTTLAGGADEVAASGDALLALAHMAVQRGAIPVMYLTWGWQSGDAAMGIDAYLTMQERVINGYKAVTQRVREAVSPQAFIAPVGLAWESWFAQCNAAGTMARWTALYNPHDGFHPSLQGTYLAACTIAAALSGMRVAGNPVAELCARQEPASCVKSAASLGCTDEPSCAVAPGGCELRGGACIGNLATGGWNTLLQAVADEAVFSQAAERGFPPFPWQGGVQQ